MGETERRDISEQEIGVLIKEAQAQQGGMDAKAALGIIVNALKRSPGYYTWAPLGEGFLEVWQCRIPRDDLSEEGWLKDEPADIIHICRPAKFAAAVEQRDKEGSSDFCGYVRDDNNKTKDETTLKCAKCKREMPVDLAKKGLIQLQLHKLGKKR